MTSRALDPQAQQLVRQALAEHNTGTIVRAGRRPTPSWVRPVRLGTNEADRAIQRYLDENPAASYRRIGTTHEGAAVYVDLIGYWIGSEPPPRS